MLAQLYQQEALKGESNITLILGPNWNASISGPVLLIARLLMFLAQVIGPVNDVEEKKGKGKDDTGNDINLFGAELEGVHPFQKAISTPHWNFTVQQSAGGNHRRAFDSSHQGIL